MDLDVYITLEEEPANLLYKYVAEETFQNEFRRENITKFKK